MPESSELENSRLSCCYRSSILYVGFYTLYSLAMAWLSKDLGKDILGGVKQALTSAQGPLKLVPIPALAAAVDAVLGIITAIEVR